MRAAILSAACLLAGCAPGEPWVEVGGGDGDFLPLSDGDVLEVERGTQGGQHVWVGLRAGGIEPGSVDPAEAALLADRPRIELTLDGPDGRYSLDNTRYLALADSGEGCFGATDLLLQLRHFAELPADWQQIDWRAREADLEQLDFVLTAQLVDTDGLALEDARTVRLAFP